ncbi:MAG: aminotransferase class V-fold PLP-dependent enzyme [Acidobacteriaceae bacterium]|nr:aminotransferase class V-fold PLP-dependent enzyme [Acidobacteriaceae bacterium]MBV9294317.1 aminotransferase class V-fold PLP-dependent enzyme [Acidobacteriaceae bacterium]MBV9766465.1 aminotransferase class V-fold PLP-dependent enzyme [Acidobacteriaceae bacterium]
MGYQKIAEDVAEPPPALHTRFRSEFPVTRELIYLNHAAVAPLCRPAAEAMKHLAEDACLHGSLHYSEWMDTYEGLRQAAANLINASTAEIAIVKNTSEGISTVAGGFDWRPGDRIIAFQEEFPSNYYPWLRLEKRGVDVTWLSIYDPIERIAEALPGARLLAISYVNYLSGYRVDLKTIGELCQRHNCFFLVDAIQGMGVFPIDVEACHIDALAADGHKWMLGPEGNGVLYVRRKWLDAIEPVEFGWTNPASYADYSSRDMTLRPDAGRYECGTLNTIGCFGLRAAIEFLLEVGIEQIATAVESRANQLEAGVLEKGYEVMVKRTTQTGSGIVSFRHPFLDCRSIVSDLKQNRIAAAPRQGWVRMSPHFYISPDDIEQAVELLPGV